MGIQRVRQWVWAMGGADGFAQHLGTIVVHTRYHLYFKSHNHTDCLTHCHPAITHCLTSWVPLSSDPAQAAHVVILPCMMRLHLESMPNALLNSHHLSCTENIQNNL